MRGILQHYLTVLVACAALLLGLQAPNLADQYQKRVDAHLREVTANLLPFQAIADKYFGGDLDKLIVLHRNSSELPFQEEGAAIEQMVQRKQRFEAELAAMTGSLPARVWHVLMQADDELRDETLAQYSYNVPMDAAALSFGALFTLGVLGLLEALLAVTRALLRKPATQR